PVPVLEARLLDLLRGQWEVQAGERRLQPLPSPWSYEKARGYELIFPITFQQHCLITAERPGLQYQIQWRSYPAETVMPTWNTSALLEHNDTLHKLAEKIQSLDPPSTTQLARQLSGNSQDDIQQVLLDPPILAPGTTRQLDLLQRPGENPSRAIVLLEAQVEAERMVDALRRASPRGKLVSYWIMPYAKHARLTVQNFDEQPVNLQLTVTHVPYRWNPRSMYFHASWRNGSFISRPYQDWSLLDIQGCGHLTGTHLAVYNTSKEWWGEGDSKVWIDEQPSPALWGTGTEDDFGLGLADKTIFSSPWRGQPRHDGQRQGHEGHTSLLRARLLDRISFQKRLRYDLEIRHDQPNTTILYAATSFWYALPGARTDRMTLDREVLRGSLPGGPP
ncbi:MAG TPA: DUF2961 domain-containing protein, partial [Gemmatales bacterium]|nr:DUF2961 domain-containing protein [Gemmatales bacterium]